MLEHTQDRLDPVLQGQFDALLDQVVPDVPKERYSEHKLLRRGLSPYLTDYPALATDLELVRQAVELWKTPIEVPDGIYATGVLDAAQDWIAEEQRRRLSGMLEQHKSEEIA